jgi:hypothetical protein
MRRAFLTWGALITAAGCGNTKLQRTLPPNVHVDTYSQQAASAVDVLWVVDNSGSMEPHQQNVAQNFASFIKIFTRGSIDYRIAVTTTDIFHDQGKFVGTPAIISPQTPDVIGSFESNISVGVNGSANSEGLEAAMLAVSRQQQANANTESNIATCQASCPSGASACQQACLTQFPVEFLRPGAYVYFVFVQDDDDSGSLDVRYVYRALADAQGIGNDGTVSGAAITGIQPAESCASAALAPRYIDVATLLNGQVGDICDASFADTLHRLSTDAIGLKRKFALSTLPNVQTLTVSLKYPCNTTADVLAPCAATDDSGCQGEPDTFQGLVCTPVQGGPDGWSYESDNNLIFFAGNSVPDLNAEIDIEYYLQGTSP